VTLPFVLAVASTMMVLLLPPIAIKAYMEREEDLSLMIVTWLLFVFLATLNWIKVFQ